MEQILQQYNKSVGDVAKLKKKAKKICESQPVREKKPTYEKGEDGWITVNRDRKDIKSAGKKQKKEKEKLINFYTFELKEEKLKKHKELLKKFEDDKKRLMEMRAKRKFKV